MRVAFVPALFALCVLTGPSHAVDVKKVRPAAVAPAEQARVTDTVRSLGFTVGKVIATGPGQWEVQVEAYDPARAAAALRGTIRGPAMQFSKPGLQAMSVRGGVRGGGVRPGSGPLATDEDGSQTGSGQGGEMPDDPFGIGDGGGSTPGEHDGGGSATGGGNDPGPDNSGGGSPRSRTLRVISESDGALRIDVTSLRALGLDAGTQPAGAKVRIR